MDELPHGSTGVEIIVVFPGDRHIGRHLYTGVVGGVTAWGK